MQCDVIDEATYRLSELDEYVLSSGAPRDFLDGTCFFDMDSFCKKTTSFVLVAQKF